MGLVGKLTGHRQVCGARDHRPGDMWSCIDNGLGLHSSRRVSLEEVTREMRLTAGKSPTEKEFPASQLSTAAKDDELNLEAWIPSGPSPAQPFHRQRLDMRDSMLNLIVFYTFFLIL